jgi:Flp pilus assembly pilin Flp
MSMKTLTSFLSDESGAVTVDWVVLTAALVGLGLAVISVVSGGLEDLSGDIATQLGQDHVTAGFTSSD